MLPTFLMTTPALPACQEPASAYQPPGPFLLTTLLPIARYTDLTLYPEDNTVGKPSRSDLVLAPPQGLEGCQGCVGAREWRIQSQSQHWQALETGQHSVAV